MTAATFETLIYLDHHATTPTDPRVVNAMVEALSGGFGNASSADHAAGAKAAAAVADAAGLVAGLVGSARDEVVFTSGATEALNLAIAGHLAALPPRRHRVVTSPTEHPAVLGSLRRLARLGSAEVVFLSVDALGRIDLDEASAACSAGAAMLCVMAANNEIGTIAPVAELAALAADHGTTYVCDATQAVGKVPLDVGEWGIDLLALSAHKLYGPPGVGALVARRGTRIEAQIVGGSQQGERRAGTLNVPGIVGLAEACRLRQLEMAEDETAIARLRDALGERLQAMLPEARVNGDAAARLAGNLHITIPGVPNDAVIARIRDRLAISTGAACSSGVPAPSHVLKAIGLPPEYQEGAFRFGLGKSTTAREVDLAAELFIDAVRAVRDRLAIR